MKGVMKKPDEPKSREPERDEEIEKYNAEVDEYNAEVDRYNAGKLPRKRSGRPKAR
jgi:hypothetical protein